MGVERYELVEVFGPDGEPAKVRPGKQLEQFIASGYSRDKPKKKPVKPTEPKKKPVKPTEPKK